MIETYISNLKPPTIITGWDDPIVVSYGIKNSLDRDQVSEILNPSVCQKMRLTHTHTCATRCVHTHLRSLFDVCLQCLNQLALHSRVAVDPNVKVEVDVQKEVTEQLFNAGHRSRQLLQPHDGYARAIVRRTTGISEQVANQLESVRLNHLSLIQRAVHHSNNTQPPHASAGIASTLTQHTWWPTDPPASHTPAVSCWGRPMSHIHRAIDQIRCC
jgi:hypothetical protein